LREKRNFKRIEKLFVFERTILVYTEEKGKSEKIREKK
jgi:hypothetical protein